MFKINSYIINQRLNLLMGEYDQHGKLCTRVWEVDKSFLVDMPPLEVLDKSLNYINSNLKAATISAKSIVDNKSMCPIAVNPFHEIILFPHLAPSNEDCIWFNEIQIKNTLSEYRKTKVIFHNGDSIIIDARLTPFNNKIQTAYQLRKVTSSRLRFPGMVYLDTQTSHEITKEKNGRYNFKALEEEDKE